jgi:hypothetical protein
MDAGTAKDHIEDLMQEIKVLRADLSSWSRIGHMAFTHAEGCLPGCRRACMCTCGYEHYVAQVAQEARRD